MKSKHMNQTKHTPPDYSERPSKHRASPIYVDGMPVSAKNATVKKMQFKCNCGVITTKTVAYKTNKYFNNNFTCDECLEQEKMFGKDKNFLTALEGL